MCNRPMLATLLFVKKTFTDGTRFTKLTEVFSLEGFTLFSTRFPTLLIAVIANNCLFCTHSIDFFSRYSYNEPTTVSFKDEVAPNEPVYSKLNMYWSRDKEKEGDYAQPHWNGGPSQHAVPQATRSHNALSPVPRNRYTHMHSNGFTPGSPGERLEQNVTVPESLYSNMYEQPEITYSRQKGDDVTQREADQIYEQISNFDVQERVKSPSVLEADPQPYSVPVKST